MKDSPNTSARKPPTNAEARLRAPRRRWRWLIVAAILVLGLMALAPTLAASVFLKQILGRASREVNGHLLADSASFGWFSPLELRNLEGRDQSGSTVFQIGTLKTERSLWQLLTSRSPGKLHVDSSKFQVVTRTGGSNVEDFLEPLFKKPAGKKPLDVSFDIKDAQIELRSAAQSPDTNSSMITVPSLSGRYHREKHHAWQITGMLNVTAGQQSGAFKIDSRGSGIPLDAQPDLRAGTVHLDAQLSSVPLAALQPIVRRFTNGFALQGMANGQMRAKIEKGQAHIAWNELGTQENKFYVSRLSREKPLLLNQWQSSGQLRWSGDDVFVDAHITSDVGSADLKITSLAAGDTAALLRILTSGNLDLDAEVDLPQLARALPDRMGLRDDVSITSGSVALKLHSEPRDDETQWTALLTTSDLAGRRGNTDVVWPDPISAELQARWTNGRLTIDVLECRSEFLTANLKGTPDDAEVILAGDLQRLADRMRQFFHLPAGFAGKLDGKIHYQRRAPELLIDGEITATDFLWNLSSGTQLHEPIMVLTGESVLRQNAERRIEELSSGSLQLVAGDDLLRCDLKKPLALGSRPVPLAVTLRGNLAQWKTRLQTFVDVQRWSVSGLCDATGDISLHDQLVDIKKLQGEIHDLIIGGEGVRIVEPRVTIDLEGQWNGAEKKWTSTHGEFASSAMSASGDNILIAWGDQPAATGRLMIRADLTRVQNWFPSSKTPQQRLRLAGEFIGEAYLDHESETTLLQLDGAVEGFEIAQPRANAETTTVANAANNWTPLWHEKEAELNATARWRSEGKLQIHSARLSGEGWEFVTNGDITGLPSAPILGLEGNADYDWQVLSSRLRITAGETLAVSGQRHEPFVLQGPLYSSGPGLVSPELKGSGGFGWDSARFQGIIIGEGQVRTELENSLLTLSIIDVPVSEGTLSLTSNIDLRQSPAQLEIPPSTVLNDIQITPAMTRTWLKYVLPQIADVSSAEGSFDLQFDHVAVPLAYPQTANVQGALIVKNAKLGAGPLTEVMVRIAEMVGIGQRRMRLNERLGGTWVEIPSQVVAFEMKDGSVLHRDLQLNVMNLVTVHSSGSVNVDQTYDVTFEIPVPESNSSGSFFSNLGGKTLRLRVRGKFGEKLDVGSIVRDFARENLKESAGAAAETLLDEGLRRLFRDRN